MTPPVVPGLDYRHVDVAGVTINCAIAGSGPSPLRLHGYPQNHLIWRQVGPGLARDHTVVVAGLRGYRARPGPSRTQWAACTPSGSWPWDQVGLMRELGFGRFGLVGHDCGARVALRLVLDHPEAVARLAVLDIVPTRHAFHHVSPEMGLAYYHWFFLPRPNGIPEHMIAADPAFWVGSQLGTHVHLEPHVMADYIRCFSDPGTIADYCAAANTDLVDDDESFAAGQNIGCPVLVLWGTRGFVRRAYEPLNVWQEHADEVRGTALPAGHFLPEEAPGPRPRGLGWLSRRELGTRFAFAR